MPVFLRCFNFGAAAVLLMGFLVSTGTAVAATIAPVARGTPIDEYLVAGQSNMTGQGYMQNLPKNFHIDTRVLLYHSAGDIHDNCSPDTWVPLQQA